ncbi:hypothetical protein PEBR_21418 [Penicillium brasilianum]|uniref:FAD binding domain protein n=1 Tax=Penicillium brasilianum TaxID=104259 RepID=A0A1S9RMD9_PENBI|nr:hypothetical protein PEBR_21418 [Penicillium brasilianum]
MASGLGRKAVQGIAAGIGLVSEARSARKTKKRNQKEQSDEETVPETVRVPQEQRELPQQQQQQQKQCEWYEVIVPCEPTAQQEATHENPPTGSLEEQWALDEAQEELGHSAQGKENTPENDRPPEYVDQERLAHAFASTYPAPPPYSTIYDGSRPSLPQLSAPVVLPQRRPKNRDRGFIRAYAPTLNECGIDQEMFIDFLNTAEKACQAAKWLNAINLASIGTMWLPTVTGLAVSIAIQIATDVAIAADGRRKTNTFFDKMNKEFFQPRGLYCLLMTWNPELPDAPATTIDLNSFISKAADGGSSSGLERLRHKFKSSDGKAYGNIFPEVAPLVFPQIDQVASDKDAQKKFAGMKKKKQFVDGYLDKRAQAKFAAENPDSHLTQGPKPTFNSRYADPNHVASSGDPLALITGGHLTLEKLSAMKGRGARGFTDQYQERRDYDSNPPAPHGRPFSLSDAINTIRDLRTPQNGASRAGYAEYAGPLPGGRGQDRSAENRDGGAGIGPFTPIAKLLKKKVLYLAIVNMPSEDEMSRAREALGQTA